jgi:four helix bundle protein
MNGGREFARFIGYSIASTSELEYHLIAARDLGLMPASEFHALVGQLVEVRKMLYGLLRRVRGQSKKQTESDQPPSDRSAGRS